MILNPIIPIWLMAILCVGMLLMKRKGVWPFVRQIIIVILLFIINLRPMFPKPVGEQDKTEMNLYVVFVVDDTISMIAQDYNGTEERLAGVRQDCSYIVDNLPGARFSVLTFHNSATLASPFTDNAEHIKNTVNAIYPLDDFYARGSSLNTAKELLLSTLKQAKEKQDGKVVVFFISDGEITDDSKLESYQELAEYVDGGAVLGYGTSKGGKMYLRYMYEDEPVEIQDKSDYPYKPAVSKIDEGNLKQLAGDMGIEYIHMTESENVGGVLENIKNDVSTSTTTGISIVDENMEGAKDIYFYFAIPLLMMLMYEAVIWIRRKE